MRHMLSSALIAGFAAGLLCALLQYFLVEPKILLAERYESGELVHFQGGPTPAEHAAAMAQSMPGMDMPAADAHEHGAEEVESPYRNALTVLFAVLTYCGYGLVFLAIIQAAEVFGIRLSRTDGLLWGLAGFAAFQLMPALGLEPELPGTPAADLTARQLWWVATAICTLAGLGLMAYGGAMWRRVIGVVLLAVPHVWGAPELASFGGVVPPELAASFAARSLAVGMITWMTLGSLVVTFWQSEPAT